MNKVTWIQTLFACSGFFAFRSYVNHADKLKDVQEKLLKKLLQKNAQTLYGLRHDFATIKNLEEYQDKVPLLEDWEQLAPLIQEMALGKEKILFEEDLLAFEETSGTSGPSKLIPYTADLRNEFQQAIGVWMFDLWRTCKPVFRGKAFWSISPALRKSRQTSAGIQIGLERDSDYFNPLLAKMIEATQAVLPPPAAVQSTEAYYNQVLSQLLACENLSFVSCWSPSYFLLLDEHLRVHWDKLLAGLNETRKKSLRQLNPASVKWSDIWPALSLLSCWASAQSALFVPAVRRALGAVTLQGKGLLATEYVGTLPLSMHSYPLLAYTSMVYEFRETSSNQILLAHQLKEGNVYELIISNSGGLYRYATKDLVRCMGYWKQIPALDFIGRTGEICDLVGEKLNGWQLNHAIHEVFGKVLHQIKYIALAGFLQEGKAGYRLLVEADEEVMDGVNKAVQELEQTLMRNPYYAQAVHLGQLKSLLLLPLPAGTSQRLQAWINTKNPIPDGQQKPRILLRENDLPNPFMQWLNT